MFPSRLPSLIVAVLLFLGYSIPAFGQRGAITVRRNLAELTDRADLIVRGFVSSAKFEPHPEFSNLKTVVVTLQVKETLKGRPSATYTFRQFIWDIRDRFNAAGYQKGQDLLLLMNKPSAIGLTSPVGLEQGRFRVIRDAAGNKFAVNGHANAALFDGMQPLLRGRNIRLSPTVSKTIQQRQGAVRVADLSEVIRALAAKR